MRMKLRGWHKRIREVVHRRTLKQTIRYLRKYDRRKRLNLIPDKPTYVSRLTATFYLPRTSLYRYLRALSTTNPLDSRENTKRWDRIVEIKRLSQDFIAFPEIEEKAAGNTLRFSAR